MNTSSCKSALAVAIIENDVTSLKELIASGADVNEFSYFRGHGESPLLTAIRCARQDMIDILLHSGADVNIPCNRGHTPLLRSVQRNFYAILKSLLEHGATVNAIDTNGHNPLSWAVKFKNLEAVKELISYGGEVNIPPDSIPKPSLLHLAADSPEILNYLLEEGAEVNILDDSGETPLFSAVRADNLANVRTLLDQGSIVNAVNQDLRTPLHLAAGSVNNSVEVIELLLEYGAYVNSLDRYLSTPLVLTLRGYILKPNYEVARCLIQHGSDLRYELCTTSLEWTAGFNADVLKFAVKAGFKLDNASWVRDLLSSPDPDGQWYVTGRHNQHKKHVIEIIRQELRRVHSLASLCRTVVREKIIDNGPSCSIFKSIAQLPLPEPVKVYLQLTEEPNDISAHELDS